MNRRICCKHMPPLYCYISIIQGICLITVSGLHYVPSGEAKRNCLLGWTVRPYSTTLTLNSLLVPVLYPMQYSYWFIQLSPLCDKSSQEPHPVMFELINGALICDTALKTEGGAGPSGIDAAGWRWMVTSFQKESVELCEVVAMVARRICCHFVDPLGLAALLHVVWWPWISIQVSGQWE